MRLKHEPPHHRHRNRGRDHGEENQRAKQRASPEVLVKDQSYQHPKHSLDDDGADGVGEGAGGRRPESVIGKEVGEVGKPHPFTAT